MIYEGSQSVHDAWEGAFAVVAVMEVAWKTWKADIALHFEPTLTDKQRIPGGRRRRHQEKRRPLRHLRQSFSVSNETNRKLVLATRHLHYPSQAVRCPLPLLYLRGRCCGGCCRRRVQRKEDKRDRDFALSMSVTRRL